MAVPVDPFPPGPVGSVETIAATATAVTPQKASNLVDVVGEGAALIRTESI